MDINNKLNLMEENYATLIILTSLIMLREIIINIIYMGDLVNDLFASL